MITINKYNLKALQEWDQFISDSNNGTIFQKQRFINYHINRKFVDHSLLIKKNNKLVAVLPAAVCDNILYSHPGSSYGGFVVASEVDFETTNDIIQSVDDYCRSQKFKSLFLISSPSVYQKKFDQSIDYLLHWNNYKSKEIYISHVVDMSTASTPLELLKKRKRRYINNNKELDDFSFKESNDFDLFYKILLEGKKKYNTKPTHTLEELYQLKTLFPEEIKLMLSIKSNQVIGGSVIFFANRKVSLVFYNAISKNYRNSQIAMLQLYKCMEVSKKYGYNFVDFGVSHTPEQDDPMSPKFSLIHFKEQFDAKGVLRVAHQKEYCDHKK